MRRELLGGQEVFNTATCAKCHWVGPLGSARTVRRSVRGPLDNTLDGTYESIPAPGQSFDKTRMAGGVTQRLANLVDRRVDAPVEVHKGAVAPKFLPQFLAGDHFARTRQQGHKHPKRLVLQLDLDAALAQLTGGEVGFEDPKADHSTKGELFKHRGLARLILPN